jgi:hypothetical protein
MKQLNICFFDSNHAKIIWRNVHIATGLTPPKSVSHMLRNELITGIRKKERKTIDFRGGCSSHVGHLVYA